MIIDFIEMSGFRGFREPVHIGFSRGFTVVTGRNGVGKSTICDAMEFVLTGDITKYRVEKSDNESIADYLWWRGDGRAEEHYVTLGVIVNGDTKKQVTRSRENGLSVSIQELENLICESGISPGRPLEQFCRTSLVRDEWIAAQSLDLKETERFDLVSMALGEIGNDDYSERVQEVIKIAQGELALAERVHEEAREELSRSLSQMSQLQSSAQRSEDVAPAIETLSKYIPDLPSDLSKAAGTSRSVIEVSRGQLAVLSEALLESKEIDREEKELISDDFQSRKSAIQTLVSSLETQISEVGRNLEHARQILETEEQSDDLITSLVQLIEGGEKHGLNSGHCPLCDAERSEHEFLSGIAMARERAGKLGKRLARTRQNVAKLAEEFNEISSAHKREQQKLTDMNTRELLLNQRKEKLAASISAHVPNFDSFDQDSIGRKAQQLRNALIDIERSLSSIESSRSVAKVAAFGDVVKDLRGRTERASIEFERRKRAVEAAKEFDRTIKRTRGEIIDERLAALSPLLSELYQRLRPHSDWQGIDYSIRGDVRRFLSLKVGDNLNPQFVFSSGQRRAAGIAFLLSVYLARPWCRLDTLILDDPVQHVDDYRAVHLVELLAALRRDGHQIICTIEDSSLADLLTRRLAGSQMHTGRRYDLSRIEPGVARAVYSDIDAMHSNVIELSSIA